MFPVKKMYPVNNFVILLVIINCLMWNFSGTSIVVVASVSNENDHYNTENLLMMPAANINFSNTTTAKIIVPANRMIDISSSNSSSSSDDSNSGSGSGSSSGSSSSSRSSSFLNSSRHHNTRIRRSVSPFDENEIGWTNINEEVDMALKTIWPQFIEQGYTTLALPNLSDTISVRPLLITYSAGLRLTNGYLHDIEEILRSGDAYMTYFDKSFQFRLNLILTKQQFEYDFIVGILGIEAGGAINGFLEQLLVSGDFSIRVTDANIKLNDFKILSFGNIGVSLKHSRIIKQLSSIILTPITNFFMERMKTTISDAIRVQLQNLMIDINNNDTLELKKFVNTTVAGLVG